MALCTSFIYFIAKMKLSHRGFQLYGVLGGFRGAFRYTQVYIILIV